MDGRISSVKKPPVANKVIDRVVVLLDGREWQLVVTTNVLCELESMTGVNALFGAESVFTRPTAKTLRALLYICLREQGAEYTLEEVGNLITAKTLPLVTKGLMLAWVASMPKKEDVESEMGEIRAAV
jgi:hypothetical protein